MSNPGEGDVSYEIDTWLELLRPAAEKQVGDTGEKSAQLRQLEHSAVLTSLENLHTFDFVAQAVAEKKLTLHGAWIDIGAGELRTFNPKEGSFQPL
ncbi:MAG: carbonic anhydrase [Burkholderiaceae bacterium]